MDVTGRTLVQAEPYRAKSLLEPDIILVNQYQKLYEAHPYLGEDDAQYVSCATEFYSKLLDFDGMMLHSSAVVVDDRAYLFSADSGTGKSTHTELWLKKFGDRAYILNDDKPAIRLIDGVWHACGTPWSGKYDISRPECVPLAGIAFLNRDSSNHIEPYKGPKAVYDLLNQMPRPPYKRQQLLILLDRLIRDIPIWKLYCNMEPEAVEVSYNAMSGKVKE